MDMSGRLGVVAKSEKQAALTCSKIRKVTTETLGRAGALLIG